MGQFIPVSSQKFKLSLIVPAFLCPRFFFSGDFFSLYFFFSELLMFKNRVDIRLSFQIRRIAETVNGSTFIFRQDLPCRRLQTDGPFLYMPAALIITQASKPGNKFHDFIEIHFPVYDPELKEGNSAAEYVKHDFSKFRPAFRR
jgi:hypothetical protein